MRRRSFPRVSKMHWVASYWRSLPLSEDGKSCSPDHTTCLLTLPTKRWLSTVLDGLRSLIQKSCDLAYHCAVPENVRRTACRGSASSPSGISDLPVEPEPIEPSFQTYPSCTANLFKCGSARAIERWKSYKVMKLCGIGSAHTRTMINFFHKGGVDPNPLG
jgi:hypothetical protein